eukprot:3252712-Prymnesium_polylepis.1
MLKPASQTHPSKLDRAAPQNTQRSSSASAQKILGARCFACWPHTPHPHHPTRVAEAHEASAMAQKRRSA